MEKLIEREFVTDKFSSTAIFSECFNFRYSVTRKWNCSGMKLLYILLNPSKATEKITDPTFSRCQARALSLGYKQFRICNLFALRATNPGLLNFASDAIGPKNDVILETSIRWADTILCSWGRLGVLEERNLKVRKILKNSGKSVFHLGLTKNNQPKHLLYINLEELPKKWF